ncbi:DNA polymerase I [Curtobacterium sp. MCBA15_008]|uniref:DNA polymerase I n=1 Tax=Curtobacterium sp. MCBA15_008 TaxID=1898736 RepID=UPI0008DD3172|nr:DNA polymerase I [Curtobacterium sp. MCBA15_008]OII13468.1 DNA polymerase I [Curtobacterium sp. MCBA15_008]
MSDSAKPTLMVIDGHSLAFRAFYALPVDSFVNREGQHTNAIHGFISMLLMLLQREKPTHLAVAFDISRFSFRTREYEDYKGTRSETPAEFKGQIPLLQQALEAMGITTVTKEDYEADDILATFARQGAEQGFQVYVVSGDRDSIQLVNDDVTLLYPSVRGVSELTRYDRDKVYERYGIEPHQYPDIAALVGETSDNLIGIDKVGEKTAVKWITQFGSLDAVLEHADEIKGVVGNNLREQKDRAIRNRRLNRLVNDVELPVGPADVALRPLDEDAVRELFAKLQFRTLLDRVFKVAGSGEPSEASTSEGAIDSGAPTPPPVKTLIDEELGYWLERRNASEAANGYGVAVEVIDGRLSAIGIATHDDAVMVPGGSGAKDYEQLAAWFASDAPKHFHDAKAAIKALATVGFQVNGIAGDARIMGWLAQPGKQGQPLGDLVYQELGEELPTGDPNQLVPETDPVNVGVNAWFVLRVTTALRARIDESSLRVLDDIELPLVPVLAGMETIGVGIDKPVLTGLSHDLGERAAELAQQAFAEIGHEVNLGSPKQLQEVLFTELAMPKTRKTKTGFSTDAASLADLQDQHPHPFLGLLLQHRDATKLRQIVDTLDASVVDGRIHTRYEQTGTSTGRISSTDPNLQNIPVKTAEGRRIRSAFAVAEPYTTLVTADYSQIEMRIMAHLSGDPGLIQAFNEGEDLHRFVGARVFSVEPADVTPEMRTKVKAMSYGLAYGLSPFGLSKQLRIEQSEARTLMNEYFARFGAVRDYLRGVVEQAREDGYTETIFGRRRPFPDLKSPNRVLRENAERAALNAPIQGSAADIMKIAMLGVAEDLRQGDLASHLLLQVHDELILEVAPGEQDRVEDILRTRMGAAAELTVPLDVSVGVGANWEVAAH